LCAPIKKKAIFAGFCIPTDAGTGRFSPLPRLQCGKQAGKNSFPQTLSFLPACWKPPAIFSDGGETERG